MAEEFHHDVDARPTKYRGDALRDAGIGARGRVCREASKRGRFLA